MTGASNDSHMFPQVNMQSPIIVNFKGVEAPTRKQLRNASFNAQQKNNLMNSIISGKAFLTNGS